MKNFLMVLMVVSVTVEAANLKQSKASGAGYTRVFNGYGLTGSEIEFTDYVSDLAPVGFDNTICSARQTGLWLYYDYVNYNVGRETSRVLYAHGIDYVFSFNVTDCDMASSLKYAGNQRSLDEDSFTIYSQQGFGGSEFYSTSDQSSLGSLNAAGNSLIITGNNPWTFYTGLNDEGISECYYPNTASDTDGNGLTINYGIYPQLSADGTDNVYESAKIGCNKGSRVAPRTILNTKEKSKNGACGIIEF